MACGCNRSQKTDIWFHRYKEKDGKMVDIEGRCTSFSLLRSLSPVSC